MEDAISQQLSMRQLAEEQASVLSEVGSWLATVSEKEGEMLSKARAQRRAASRATGSSPTTITSAATTATATATASVSSPITSLADPVDQLHADGNAAMASGAYSRALGIYTRVLCTRPTSVPALANRCLAYLKLKDYSSCVVDATLALRLDPTHTKSWMRRATSRNALGQHTLAASDLAVAHALEPTNRLVLQELRKTEELKKAAERRRPEVTIPLVEE